MISSVNWLNIDEANDPFSDWNSKRPVQNSLQYKQRRVIWQAYTIFKLLRAVSLAVS